MFACMLDPISVDTVVIPIKITRLNKKGSMSPKVIE